MELYVLIVDDGWGTVRAEGPMGADSAMMRRAELWDTFPGELNITMVKSGKWEES